MEEMNLDLSAKLRYIEERGAEFFATGASQVAAGLDLSYIPSGKDGGVNLSSNGQNLRQSYLIAKHVFEHVKPKTVKFVLIGLSLYSIPESAEDITSVFNLALADTGENTPPLLPHVTSHEDSTKEDFKANVVSDCNKFLVNDEIEKIATILEDYFKLCVDNGAKPVTILLPVEPTLRKTYSKDVLTSLRKKINAIGKKYKLVFIDLLDVKIAGSCFQQDKCSLNSTGASMISALLSERLYLKGLISAEKICDMSKNYFALLSKNFSDDYKTLVAHIFCKMACADFKRLSEILPQDECKDLMANAFSGMTYEYLAKLSDMLLKDDYNDLADRVFNISVEKIRHKSKIKIGFYVPYSSMWFGDDLYNLFASNERFELKFFVYTKSDNKVVSEERSLDAKRFQSQGINIFDLNDKTLNIPEQDILFCLAPYQSAIPTPFRLINLKLTTLLINFPYTFSVCAGREHILNSSFVRVLWRMFFPSTILLKLTQKINKVGMVRGLYSGYPKMDIFFQNVDFKFDWKMACPNSKKIIWAPHHSMTGGVSLATFHWNYEFMYEFAKVHPEISWIVKTHPALPQKAIANKIFPSIDAYEEYMQKWDDLPNAQVYYGAYYQAIFATSDGMIQDCASFVAEYQYVDKPMIYLTRDTQKFNELGKEILKASYLVDGKDFDGIAAMIQRVFIEGDDYKAAERRAVFDKYLNYPKATGMLASEFIYKNIVDELKEI